MCIPKTSLRLTLAFLVIIWGCGNSTNPDTTVHSDILKDLLIVKPSKDTTYTLSGEDTSFVVKWEKTTNLSTASLRYSVSFDDDIYPRNGRLLSIEVFGNLDSLIVKKSDFKSLQDTLFFMYISASSGNIKNTRSYDVRKVSIIR